MKSEDEVTEITEFKQQDCTVQINPDQFDVDEMPEDKKQSFPCGCGGNISRNQKEGLTLVLWECDTCNFSKPGGNKVKIVKQSWDYIDPIVEGSREAKLLAIVEKAGKLCYQSIEDKKSTAQEFVKKALRLGHHSVIEHASIGVIITTDRGVTHELVRHRIASFSQESTRYCNYSKDKFGNQITMIDPSSFFLTNEDHEIIRKIEAHYMNAVESKRLTPQQARYFLPNGLKAQIAVTANIREWRHILTLRTSAKAHPDICFIMADILKQFKIDYPTFFGDL